MLPIGSAVKLRVVRRSAVAVLVVLLVAGCGGSSRSPQLFSGISVTKVLSGAETTIQPPQFTPWSFVFSNSKRGWLGFYRNAEALKGRELLETRDGGRSWAPTTSRPPSELAATPNAGRPCGKNEIDIASAVSFWSSSDGYAVCGSEPGAGNQLKWLYQTTDGGKTWRERASDKQLPEYGYVSELRFFDREHGLMLTERGGIYATADGGLKWRGSFYNPGEGTIYWSFPDRRDIYVTAWDNGVFVSHDLGRTWKRVWPPLSPIGPISFSSPSDAIGVGAPSGPDGIDDTAILRSTDGGRSWKSWGRIATEGAVAQLVRVSRREVVALASGANDFGPVTLFRSDDNGRNWRKLSTLKTGKDSMASFDSLSLSGSDAYLFASNGRLFSSSDSGMSWRPVSRHADFHGVLALGGKNLLATTTGSFTSLYASSDGGHRWKEVPIKVNGTEVSGWEVVASDPQHIWISDGQNMLLRTEDGGRHWTAYRFDRGFQAGETFGGLDFVSPTVGFASLSLPPYHPVLVTEDGGMTWKPLPPGPTLPG